MATTTTVPTKAGSPPGKTNGKAGAGMTKMEAVRRALAELGRDAKPLQIQAFVKQRFGIDMTNDHATTAKGVVLKQQARKGQGQRKKAGAQKLAAGNGQTRPGMSKLEAVAQALATLGRDAKPLAIQAFVKQRLGIDISTDVVSVYKKELARRAARAKAVGKAEVVPTPPVSSIPAMAGTSTSGGIPLDDILTVKALVARHGADSLCTLVNAFTR
jgi:hypothetical protein